REGTGEGSGEQPVRQGSGSGRRECAPRRTREKDHLGALNKLAGGGSLQPEQVGHCQTSRISCLVSAAGKRLERQNAWTDKDQRIARGAFCHLGILVVYLRSFIRS